MDDETKNKIGDLVKSTTNLRETLQQVGPQLIIEYNREFIKKVKEKAFFEGFLWGFTTSLVFGFIFVVVLIV